MPKIKWWCVRAVLSVLIKQTSTTISCLEQKQSYTMCT